RNRVTLRGHAIECRIYAEDPMADFAPSIGKITEIIHPDGFGVRVDSGIREHEQITPYYDPLISKLICWAPTRGEAIAKMKRALLEYRITGVETTISYCLSIMKNRSFLSGDYNTHFIKEQMGGWIKSSGSRDLERRAAESVALINYMKRLNRDAERSIIEKPPSSSWKMTGRRENLR
ncbi:MAG: acetyl-CoA carboxylase biotin carboxylase subunit, partial [Fidelibacterota bacterium]